MLTKYDLALPRASAKQIEPLIQSVMPEPRRCFSNAFLLALQIGGWYCEGYAVISAGIPIEHAWAIKDSTIYEITPIWASDPHKTLYMPTIAYKPEIVIEHMRKIDPPFFYKSEFNASDSHAYTLRTLYELWQE